MARPLRRLPTKKNFEHATIYYLKSLQNDHKSLGGGILIRILHLDYDDLESPWGGGQAIRTFEINRRLAGKHDITVVTSRFPGVEQDTVRENVRYHRVGSGRNYYLSFLLYLLNLPVIVSKSKADLVIEDFTVPFSTGLTPLYTGKQVIASVQNLFARQMAEKYHVPFHWVERYGARLYRRFIVPSRTVGSQVAQLNGEAHIEVIPEGVDKHIFELEPQDGDFLLFLGRIDVHQKGLDLLLEALRLALDSAPIRLIVAGAGHDLPDFQRRVQRLHLEDHVQIVGRVIGEAKYALLSECRFVCIPSRYETFSIVLHEAFAAQKPVVVFSTDIFQEVAPAECSLHAKPFDVEEYAQALLSLWCDKDRRLAMGTMARQHARQFDWDVIAQLQEDFYRKVVEGTA